MTTKTKTKAPAQHVADSQDLIRVHGARVNNLKDVSIEIPKRRLTVFTSELFPESETPVNTVSRCLGISMLTSLRLFTRARCTRIRS